MKKTRPMTTTLKNLKEITRTEVVTRKKTKMETRSLSTEATIAVITVLVVTTEGTRTRTTRIEKGRENTATITEEATNDLTKTTKMRERKVMTSRESLKSEPEAEVATITTETTMITIVATGAEVEVVMRIEAGAITKTTTIEGLTKETRMLRTQMNMTN